MRTFLVMLLLAAPGAAQADYYYEYQTLEGTLSFTDELRRVPAKYRDLAERQPASGLFDYDRTTIVKEGASTASKVTLLPSAVFDDGIERRLDWSANSRFKGGRGMSLDLGQGVKLDVQGKGEEPIHVDRNVRTGSLEESDGDIDTSRTVIRQGDKDLVYIDER